MAAGAVDPADLYERLEKLGKGNFASGACGCNHACVRVCWCEMSPYSFPGARRDIVLLQKVVEVRAGT